MARDGGVSGPSDLAFTTSLGFTTVGHDGPFLNRSERILAWRA